MKKEKIESYGRLVLLEVAVLFVVIFLSVFLSSPSAVFAAVGEDNVTVTTLLDIGNVYPEVINMTINHEASIDLTANSSTLIYITANIRDYNGKADIANATVEFFDNAASFYGDTDDNNHHYTNSSCEVDTSGGDPYAAVANCTLSIQYYANNETWNATMLITDTAVLTDTDSDTETVNTLLALALPDSIDYGEVNATEVSDEVSADVFNAGNVELNLSLSGYAVTEGDGYAMNCTLGSSPNIDVHYEKFNLTSSTTGDLTLGEFELDGGNYTNLTAPVQVRQFDLGARTNDVTDDAFNSTYWRIYVPLGVAGSCEGNIIFGAVEAPAS